MTTTTRLGPHGVDFVPIGDLLGHPLFKELPYKFLEYHDRTVVRRRYKVGEVVCEEGDFGATAYVIIGGTFEILLAAPRGHVVAKKGPGRGRWFSRFVNRFEAQNPSSAGKRQPLPQGHLPPPPAGEPMLRTPKDLILGELSCLSHQPRTATIVARSNGCEIWEIRRNFLDALRRSRGSRDRLDEIYRERAVPDLLGKVGILRALPEDQRNDAIRFLQGRVDFVRVDPGRVIFEQGEPADDMYFVRVGFVKVSQSVGRTESVLDYQGPNTYFGEIGLLTASSVRYLPDEVLARGLPEGFAPGTRTATCTALDHVELVRVRGSDFNALMTRLPLFRKAVIERAEELLLQDLHNRSKPIDMSVDDLVGQGLFHANQLLVLDLNKCTRCDECTRACSDTHGGVTRLIREGLRYGHFLVATSCRSCQDPYCLYGCPVDAIHRRPPPLMRAPLSETERERNKTALEIIIEPWCIGCSLCSQNCPYGNINMAEAQDPLPAWPKAADAVERLTGLLRSSGEVSPPRKAVVRKAVTCDLCSSIGVKDTDEVSCVYACPHDAAHRKSGPDLLELVRAASQLDGENFTSG